jgi:hypothetical protein
MFDKLRKKLYFDKLNVLFDIGLRDGKIVPLDDGIIDKMNDTIIACLPVSIWIKHAKDLFAQGTCYDRSLYMFLALDDAILVRGDNKDLEYNYGPGHEGHGWIELGDYVYEPSLGYRFDKDYYYKLYKCSNLRKCDRSTYDKQHADFISKYVSTDYSDFKPGGKRRLELGILIFQIVEGAKLTNNQALLDDLQKYLDAVEYDEDQIQEERWAAIEEMAKSDLSCFVGKK